MFVNRVSELALLDKHYQSRRAELFVFMDAAVLGRPSCWPIFARASHASFLLPARCRNRCCGRTFLQQSTSLFSGSGRWGSVKLSEEREDVLLLEWVI